MMGTFAAMLAKEKIPTPEKRFHADVVGEIENVDGVLKIVRIKVDYMLQVPQGKQEMARAILKTYLRHCPAAQSVIGCIDISHALHLQDR